MDMGGKLKTVLRYALAVSVLLFVGAFIISTDFSAVFHEISAIGFRFSIILFVTFVAYMLATCCWKVCLGNERKKIGIFQLFAVRQICETVGLFNPTSIVGGDLLKVEFLKQYQIDEKIALNSVVISRITVVLSQILLFLLTVIWFISTGVLKNFPTTLVYLVYGMLIFLIVCQIAFFYWLTRKTVGLSNLPPAISQFQKLKRRVTGVLWNVKIAFKHDKRAFWISYLFALLHWIIGGLEFYLILFFLGFDVKIMHGILLDMSVIVFKSLGAFIPGQLGVEELGNKVLLQAVGFGSASLWVTVSLLRRARQMFWSALGLLFYVGTRKKIKYEKSN